jgi:hypothetical protein
MQQSPAGRIAPYGLERRCDNLVALGRLQSEQQQGARQLVVD